MVKPVQTNKEAIKFCETRKARIWFDYWRDVTGEENLPDGIVCRLTISKKNYYGKTLIKAINSYIETMDEKNVTSHG